MNRRNVKKVVLSRSLGNKSASRHKLQKAEAEVAELRNLHAAGKEMLQIHPDLTLSEERDFEYLIKSRYFFEYRFSSRVKMLLANAPEFAKKYIAAELDVLCTLRRPDGSPLQVDHLELLLSLPCKTDAVNDGRIVQRVAVEKCGAGVDEGLSLNQGVGVFQ